MRSLDQTIPIRSLDQIAAVLEPDKEIGAGDDAAVDPLLAACRHVAKASRIEIRTITYQKDAPLFERLSQLGKDSGCRIRQVGLSNDWHKKDEGPLLVFRQSNERPYALVAHKAGHYRLIDPLVGGKGQLLTDDLVADILPVAYIFYRPLPETELTWKDLLRFAFVSLGSDVWRLLITQISIGLLGLLLPIVSGVIFDTVIPSASPNLLLQFIAALVVTSLATGLFQTSQSLALIRIKYKLNGVLEPALWDRLLRLPVDFFRRFSAGNLANRAFGIDTIQQQLTGAVISAALGGFFSIITLALMFYYSVTLACYALVVVFIVGIFSIIGSLIQLKYQRQIYNIQGILSGLLLQLFISISKLRVAHKETSAFQLWAEKFTQKAQWYRKSGFLQIYLGLLSDSISVVSTAMLYVLIVNWATTLSFGHFIAFNAAFGQFFAAVFAMLGVLTTILDIIPLYERAKPILNTLPEIEIKGTVITPTGNIRLHNVGFRYPIIKNQQGLKVQEDDDSKGPWIFDDLSLEINAGEFIALVGPSGSGKSTIFRLLLGFEKPEVGMIAFDNYDLNTLNQRHLRRQFGVVMQNSALLPGTILDNLRSGTPTLTIEGANELLQAVQFEKDIADMPMGLHTMLSEGGINISMGQRQRLLIAKALAHQPKILMLDEATSALDNETQNELYKYIAQLKLTRIVAAHRLSTIQDANKIYVIHEGKVVQSGTFDSLMKESGLFASLAKRQQI